MPAGVPSKRTEYVTDLTRPYHNLLQRIETGEGKENLQSYTWDTNAVFLREGERVSTYLQDELGSPVRLVELRSGRQTPYGYDEFGGDLFGNQGETQPFGYTGYQPDRIAGTSYAQAREYLPWAGRFTGRDLIKGFAELPFTLNEYGYCWNNPLILVDRNGAWPEWLEDIGKWVYENKEAIKDVIVGETVIIGSVVILSDVAVAIGLVSGAGMLGAVGGYSGIAAAVLAGGLSAGGINELTGSGSFENGYIGGAINGGLSGGLVPKVFNPYASNALGGGLGSLVTDFLNNLDKPDAEWKDFFNNSPNWILSAMTQSGIGGSLDTISQTLGLGTSEGIGWNRVAGIVWDFYKTVYAVGGNIITAGAVKIIRSPAVS